MTAQDSYLGDGWVRRNGAHYQTMPLDATRHFHIEVAIRPDGHTSVRMNGLVVSEARTYDESTLKVSRLAHALREQGCSVHIQEIGWAVA